MMLGRETWPFELGPRRPGKMNANSLLLIFWLLKSELVNDQKAGGIWWSAENGRILSGGSCGKIVKGILA
jgi:hypothetical protein